VIESECPICCVAVGARTPPGGAPVREAGFLVLGSLDARRVAGWMVIAPERHVVGWDALSSEEASLLGDLIRRASAAIKAETGAERVYTAHFSEVVPHLHVHLVPRGPLVPKEDRGPGFLFDKAPRADALEADAAARRILARLREAR